MIRLRNVIILGLECEGRSSAHAPSPGQDRVWFDTSSCVGHKYSFVYLYRTCNHESVLDVTSFEYSINHNRR